MNGSISRKLVAIKHYQIHVTLTVMTLRFIDWSSKA